MYTQNCTNLWTQTLCMINWPKPIFSNTTSRWKGKKKIQTDWLVTCTVERSDKADILNTFCTWKLCFHGCLHFVNPIHTLHNVLIGLSPRWQFCSLVHMRDEFIHIGEKPHVDKYCGKPFTELATWRDMNWSTPGKGNMSAIYVDKPLLRPAPWWNMNWSIVGRRHMSASTVVNPLLRLATWRDMDWSIGSRSNISASCVVKFLLWLATLWNLTWSIVGGTLICLQVLW